MSSLRFDVIAFVGGYRINLLGSVADVMCFFYLIEKFSLPALNKKEQIIILDRLFKRYLTIEDTLIAVTAMKIVQEKFSEIPVSDIEWEEFGVDAPPRFIKTTTKNLK
jgi:hypothetical protein